MAFKFAVAIEEPGLSEVFKLCVQGVHFERSIFKPLDHPHSDFGRGLPSSMGHEVGDHQIRFVPNAGPNRD